MSLQEKLEKELRRMWSENDTQMIMAVVDEELGEVADKIQRDKQDSESVIEDLLIAGSNQLDSVIKYYKGKINAYTKVLGLLVEDSKVDALKKEKEEN